MHHLQEIYEQICFYSQAIKKCSELDKPFLRLEDKLTDYFKINVKDKNLEQEMIDTYPELNSLFKGLNLKLKYYRKPMTRIRKKTNE